MNTNKLPPEMVDCLTELNALLKKHGAQIAWSPDFPVLVVNGQCMDLSGGDAPGEPLVPSDRRPVDSGGRRW